MADTNLKAAFTHKQQVSVQQELSELQTRLLFSGFESAYPEPAKRLFRDLTTKQRDGREPLPSFVASRIGLYLLKRFVSEKPVRTSPLVNESRIISIEDAKTMAATAGK